MAISIAWNTKIISVPKDYLSLVTGEIYMLDINIFRKDLKALEASETGMVYPDTHSHVIPITVSGTTLARVIEIINGYTITFEDGQYAVNLDGGNNNIADVTNVNQVSVRPNNSAGLTYNSIQTELSFDGKVYLDVDNGEPEGTNTFTGSLASPVDTLEGAMVIAAEYNISNIHLAGTLTLDRSIIGYNFHSWKNAKIDMNNQLCIGAGFTDIKIWGNQNGLGRFYSCRIDELQGLNGVYDNCTLLTTTTLSAASSAEIFMNNCRSAVPGNDSPCIDYTNGDISLNCRAYSGGIKIQNSIHNTNVSSFEFIAGKFNFDTTNVSGSFQVRGVVDTSNIDVNATADVTYTGSVSTLTSIVYDSKIYLDVDGSESGIKYPLGTIERPVNNLADAMILCESNNISTIMLAGTLSLTQDVSSIEFIGWHNGKIDLNNQVCVATRFKEVKIYGIQHTSSIILAFDCRIENILSMQGVFDNCNFLPTEAITVKGDTIFRHCTSQIGRPFDIDMSLVPDLHLFDWTGNLKLIHSTDEHSEIEGIDVKGNIEIDSSCNLGKFHLQGNCVITNNSIGDVEVNTDGTIATEKKLFINNKTVYLDIVNGSPGTIFPHGTVDHKTNNLTDALTILNNNNMLHLEIIGSVIVSSSHDISGLSISAARSLGNSITVQSGAITEGTYFENLSVSGVMNGSVRYTTCVLGDISNFDGGAKNSLITGNISITGTGSNYLTDCDVYETTGDYQQISIGNKLLNIIRCRGAYELVNYTGDLAVTVDLVSGRIKIASSCVSGMIVVSGIVNLIDESDIGCYVRNATITQSGIVNDTWDEIISDHVTNGTFGKTIDKINKNAGLIPALL